MLTKKQRRINWILVVVLLVLSIFFLFPVIWMLANSFKPDAADHSRYELCCGVYPSGSERKFSGQLRFHHHGYKLP